jgi:hypothetical protein
MPPSANKTAMNSFKLSGVNATSLARNISTVLCNFPGHGNADMLFNCIHKVKVQ